MINKGFGLSNRLLEKISPGKARLWCALRSAKNYNMVEKENEKFFVQIYMHHIRERIRKIFGEDRISILDAGCGQGRISVPLAMEGYDVTGVDVSSQAIEYASKYSEDKGVTVRLSICDIERGLEALIGNTFHCVISMEVLYMVKDYQKAISDMVRLLKCPGILIISLRPRLYYTLFHLMHNNIEVAKKLAIDNDVYLQRGFQNCHNADEITDLLIRNDLKDVELRGIGVLSGIEGDPQGLFSIPSQLSENDMETLLRMELKLGDRFIENGRYILASAIRI
jgi:2-polyprenyl-3-methyl-5-hydroxy-6-metoxy-1,4-benzoquinol methylase